MPRQGDPHREESFSDGMSASDPSRSACASADAAQRDRLVAGGDAALAEVFSTHRERLERMVAFRLDPRLRGRLDPADVLQEAYLRIAQRLPDYVQDPRVSPFVWIRQQTFQVLIDLQRNQFRQRRDPNREVRAAAAGDSDATSYSVACRLVASIKSPSQVVSEAEELRRVQAALESMNEVDREVLALRHFEQLGNAQVAEILGLSPTAASNRYVRAAARLAEIVAALTGSRNGHLGRAP